MAERACRCCGVGVAVPDPHHLVRRRHQGTDEPANIIPLCRTCHTLFHNGVRWVAVAIRAALLPHELAYITVLKGREWVDRIYPVAA